MKPEDHIKRYKRMRATLHDLLNKPTQDRDIASIVTIAHWASFHLVSTIVDQLAIPERLQHRNHRGVKKTLKTIELKNIIGNLSSQILNLYNNLESSFLIKYQYGSIKKELDHEELKKILEQLEVICKDITEKVQKDDAGRE
ncbi:MAG: hypothetical protein ACTSR8_22580 [Promethearchaeota archaeon]